MSALTIPRTHQDTRNKIWTKRDDQILQTRLQVGFTPEGLKRVFPDRPILAVLKRAAWQIRTGYTETSVLEAAEADLRKNIHAKSKNSLAMSEMPVDRLANGVSHWSREADEALLEEIQSGDTNWNQIQLRFPGAFCKPSEGGHREELRKLQKQCARYVHAVANINGTTKSRVQSLSATTAKAEYNVDLRLTFMEKMNQKQTQKNVEESEDSLDALNALAACLSRGEDDSTSVCLGDLYCKDKQLICNYRFAKRRAMTEEDWTYQEGLCELLEQSTPDDHIAVYAHFIKYRRDDLIRSMRRIAENFRCTDMAEEDIGLDYFNIGEIQNQYRRNMFLPHPLVEAIDNEEFFLPFHGRCDRYAAHVVRVLDWFCFAAANGKTLTERQLIGFVFVARFLNNTRTLAFTVSADQAASIEAVANLESAAEFLHAAYHWQRGKLPKASFSVAFKEVHARSRIVAGGHKTIRILNQRAVETKTRQVETYSLLMHNESAILGSATEECDMQQHPAVTVALHALDDRGMFDDMVVPIGLSSALCPLCQEFISAMNQLLNTRHIVYKAKHTKIWGPDWLLPIDIPNTLRNAMVTRIEHKLDDVLVACHMEAERYRQFPQMPLNDRATE